MLSSSFNGKRSRTKLNFRKMLSHSGKLSMVRIKKILKIREKVRASFQLGGKSIAIDVSRSIIREKDTTI